MRIEKLSSILSRMTDRVLISTGKINDFTPGSVVRSLFEAVGLEIEQFYMLTRENIIDGIEKGIIESFDLQRKEKKRAYGNVTIRFYNPLEQEYYIPRGTTFMSTSQDYPQQFETVNNFYVSPGTVEALIEVHAKEAGTIGNVPENTITVMSSATSLIQSVTNKHSFSTGVDDETQSQYKKRFNKFIDTLSRGTKESIEFGASQVDNVAGVYVDEKVGNVSVYVHDANGDLSAELARAVEVALEEYRPAGIRLEVKPTRTMNIDIDFTVIITDKSKINNLLKSRIEGVVRTYLNNLDVSQDLVLAELVQHIMNIDDSLIYDVTFSGLSSNVETKPEELIRARVIKATLI